MSDSFNTLTVVLEKPTRDDDAESTMNAIRHIKGVISVGGNVANVSEYMALKRVRHDLKQKLWHALYSED